MRSRDFHQDENPRAINRDQQARDFNRDEDPPVFNAIEEDAAFLTVDEIAKKLRTDRKTVYDAIARGEIPAVRIGRALRVASAWLRRVAA